MIRQAFLTFLAVVSFANQATACEPFDIKCLLSEGGGFIGSGQVSSGGGGGGFRNNPGASVGYGPAGIGNSHSQVSQSGSSFPEATRIFAGPNQFPPDQFAAYAMVIFKSRAVTADLGRHIGICEAYVAAIPHFSEIDTPLDQQIATVWPMESESIAFEVNRAPRDNVCDSAVHYYGLVAANRARTDAGLKGVNFSGRGPFLVAWAPAAAKGSPDAVVLEADLSFINSPAQAKAAFERWVQDIEEKPELWQHGWDLERVRLTIQQWLDYFGDDVLKAF